MVDSGEPVEDEVLVVVQAPLEVQAPLLVHVPVEMGPIVPLVVVVVEVKTQSAQPVGRGTEGSVIASLPQSAQS